MQKIIQILLLGLLCLSTSCKSQNYKENDKKLLLDEIKKDIISNIDSANYYFDLVIEEYNNGINKAETIKKYSSHIERIETKIDQALEIPNQLGREEKLTQADYDQWINEIDFTSLIKKNKILKEWGIDFAILPITNNYELSKLYTDTINHYSIRFPGNWTIFNNYENFTLMGVGPINIDTASQTKRDGGFGLSISELNEYYTSKSYYQGNLSSIKKEYIDFKLLEEKTIDLNGIEAIYVTHQCTVDSYLIVSIQFYFTDNNKGYILNGTALAPDFEKYRDLYIEIARSFKLHK